MTDRTSGASAFQATVIGIGNPTMTVPIEQVRVEDRQRPLDETKVDELMGSIKSLGIINPIVGVVQKGEDGSENVRLVAGLHRLEAAKRLRHGTIRCTILERPDALRIELAEIDENIIRNNPSPAEHAILTTRRGEILKELAGQDGTSSQIATASKQAQQRAGQSTGYDVASVRDQGRRTGESKDKVQRSRKRSGILGGLLSKVVGTSLDKGTELDALGRLPKDEREELANRAAAGEAVSARTTDRKPKPKPKHKPKLTRREQAEAEFHAWCEKYGDLDELAGMDAELMALGFALAGGRTVAKGSAPSSVAVTQEDEPCATENKNTDAPNSNS